MGNKQIVFTFNYLTPAHINNLMSHGNLYDVTRCFKCNIKFKEGDIITTNTRNSYNRKWYHKKCKDDLYIDIPDDDENINISLEPNGSGLDV